MLKKVSFTFREKRISIDARSCNSFEKFLGLMFTGRKKAEALVFEFKKPVDFRIHSFFVFFPFIAVWLDRRNKVIETKKVRPFVLSVGAKKSFAKLVEIPINRKYSKNIKILFSRR